MQDQLMEMKAFILKRICCRQEKILNSYSTLISLIYVIKLISVCKPADLYAKVAKQRTLVIHCEQSLTPPMPQRTLTSLIDTYYLVLNQQSDGTFQMKCYDSLSSKNYLRLRNDSIDATCAAGVVRLSSCDGTPRVAVFGTNPQENITIFLSDVMNCWSRKDEKVTAEHKEIPRLFNKKAKQLCIFQRVTRKSNRIFNLNERNSDSRKSQSIFLEININTFSYTSVICIFFTTLPSLPLNIEKLFMP